jgi:hypothetical protein
MCFVPLKPCNLTALRMLTDCILITKLKLPGSLSDIGWLQTCQTITCQCVMPVDHDNQITLERWHWAIWNQTVRAPPVEVHKQIRVFAWQMLADQNRLCHWTGQALRQNPSIHSLPYSISLVHRNVSVYIRYFTATVQSGMLGPACMLPHTGLRASVRFRMLQFSSGSVFPHDTACTHQMPREW